MLIALGAACAAPVTASTPVVDLDTTFGANADGFARPHFPVAGSGAATLMNVFRSANGGFLLVGPVDNGTGGGQFDIGFARLNANGTIDTSYGNVGYVHTPQNFLSAITAVAQDSQGRIVVVGPNVSGTVGAARDFAVARLLPDGSYDTGFAYVPGIPPFGTASWGYAYAVFDLGGGDDDVPNAVQILPDDSIALIGSAQTASGSDVAVAKFTAAGWLDGTFGSGGIVHFNWTGWTGQPPTPSTGTAVALNHAGSSLVIAGAVNYSATQNGIGLARLRVDGTGFSLNPVRFSNTRDAVHEFHDAAAAIAVGDDDTAYVGGTVCDSYGCDLNVDAWDGGNFHPPPWQGGGLYFGYYTAELHDVKIVPGSGSGYDVELLVTGKMQDYSGAYLGMLGGVATAQASTLIGDSATFQMPHYNVLSLSNGGFSTIGFDHGRIVLGGTTLWCCSAPDAPANDTDFVVARLRGDSVFYGGMEY